ncbi:MAG: CsgG/HfaB family protein [Candidatus Marinimicrobia bacterium]|nr:CsgG/HfaB family protein [Candidatus Neomarinimicrobiota bacterium]
MIAGMQLASAAENVYPTAIFPFAERGAGAKGYGNTASDLLFAALSAQPGLFLVEREQIDRTLQEHELSLSGMVGADEAVQVGHLIGAKILITGSVIEADRELHVVARIIGTETSRVLGETVKGKATDSLSELVAALAEKVSQVITARAAELVATVRKPEERIAALNSALGEKERPVLCIRIAERHVGRATTDPAAETEFTMLSRATGFEVVAPKAGAARQADILIEGEGFSEFAIRRGNLVSVRARLEVKASDRATERILATDRQTTVVVDLTEEIAGKAALQEAAAQIAERMLPKLLAE